ncbi:MAG: hypothetical protein PVJ30_10390 [Thiohalocapsa sp.]|jgi:hypothetical protein|uniref:hypothetical protein n=1 Tax=Thiohalocapsa sp. TaxID=2497641 RepID=UPI0025FE019B|nr:hypothetical protein [Thiohalocapsa sp.]
MQTKDRQTYRQALPNWGFETLQVMADTHRLVADIERGLRYAAHLQGLEPRVGEKLQLLRDAVGVLQVSLSACEHTTQQVLAEITEEAPGA